MQSLQTRFTLHRDLQHRDPTMVPAITSSMNISHHHQPLNNKLRKPMVEKMRRDRINSSIEQLKSLLAPEFLNQQPDSKLEKADILEIMVSFLRRQQQPEFYSSSAAVHQGFSRCAQEIVHFLSKKAVKIQRHKKLLNYFQNLQSTPDENLSESVMIQLSSKSERKEEFSYARPLETLAKERAACGINFINFCLTFA